MFNRHLLIVALALAVAGCVPRSEHETLRHRYNALRLERDGLTEQLRHAGRPHVETTIDLRQLMELRAATMASTRPATEPTVPQSVHNVLRLERDGLTRQLARLAADNATLRKEIEALRRTAAAK